MRLRPSTPLSVLLLAAFALMLIATLSAPIITSIPLGSVKGFTYGVFGYCDDKGKCSSIGLGYDSGTSLADNNDSFDMPSGVRDTLSMVLILHPVGAVLVLIMFILAVASHFHGPSHSARYLLAFFIFTVITFLICLASFIIDILLFLPHMAWGTYIVLASAIMVAASGVVTCGMRRSLISRKNRRKKIAENAEMSGENFYNREAANKPFDFTPAPITGTTVGGSDSLPAFATFESQKKEEPVSEEHIPLTSRSPSTGPGSSSRDPTLPTDMNAMNAPPRPPSTDRYGNPINGQPDAYGVARGPSMESMRSRGSQSGYRGGRGGYGRGGYDAYGAPMRGRGGYGRGGYGPRGGRGGYGPPPRGGYGPAPRRPPPPGAYGGPYDRQPSPAGAYGAYGQRTTDGYNQNQQMHNEAAGYDAYNSGLARAESPPPMAGSEPQIGQAVEMDATQTDPNQGYVPYNGQLRDNDSDVAGMVGLQQGGAPNRHDTIMSEGSKYSTDEQYLPARAAWNQGDGRNSPRALSPLNIPNRPNAGPGGTNTPPPHAQNAHAEYYDDLDPRFAGQAQQQSLHPQHHDHAYDDVHGANSGARSPAESERSTFTSISQRGVNPRWNPAPPMPQHRGPPPRPAAQQRQDMILDNPDFQVPGGRAGASGRPGPGMIPGSAYPNRGL